MDNFTLAYTFGAIALYFITSRILDHLEQRRGERFAQRNVIFFIIIFVLAIIYINFINPVPENLNTPAP